MTFYMFWINNENIKLILSYVQIKSDQTLINDGKDTKMFPDLNSSHSRITCHALCSDFLIYGNDVSQQHFQIIFNNVESQKN